MALSNKAIFGLQMALASKDLGNEVATQVNNMSNFGWGIRNVLVATNVSTTLNFGGLQVGDIVLHVLQGAGGSVNFLTVVTVGTLPAAAIVGDLYIVLDNSPSPLTGVIGAQ